MVRLQPVMVGAEHVEKVQHREVCVGPVDAVIPLQVGLGGAAADGAGGIEPLKGGLLVGGRLATEVGHPDKGFSPRQDGDYERVARLQ
jgi:hypothetical protein